MQHVDGIILTNIEAVPGRVISEVYGLVHGSTIRAKHFGRDFMAGLKNIVGGELKGYTELLEESRTEAVSRMVAQGAAEILAYGTAVLLAPAAIPPLPGSAG